MFRAKRELNVSQHRRGAAHLPMFAADALIYHAPSILIREGVMPNQNQGGSNQGGQRQSGQNQSGQNQPNQQQHTQHNDRKGQPGSQQGSSGQQSGSNDRDRMKDKSGQS